MQDLGMDAWMDGRTDGQMDEGSTMGLRAGSSVCPSLGRTLPPIQRFVTAWY